MLTREVTLQTGIRVGSDGPAKIATIREETLGDEIAALEKGTSGILAHRQIMMARVVKIGSLEAPTEAVLKKLTRTDWELIEFAIREMDLELGRQAGLIDQAGDPIEPGRAEPGGEAPGDV